MSVIERESVAPERTEEKDVLAEQAQAVLDVLRKHGWHQGSPGYGYDDGSMCLSWGLYAAAGGNPVLAAACLEDPHPIISGPRYPTELRRALFARVGNFVPWQDAPERTFEDVEAVLQEFGGV